LAGENAAQPDWLAVNSAINRVRGQLPASVQPLAQIVQSHQRSGRLHVADSRQYHACGSATRRAPRLAQRAIKWKFYVAGDEALWVQPDLTLVTVRRPSAAREAKIQSDGGNVLRLDASNWD
jgi:hypothetical protein